ncbi:hypothetical protein K4A83_09330 [Spirulina subsalsa FACHB-351]|uniref:Uncharacterized protein n=1 Tax=Spirulina subsalsa FACHB-351 TaxID=234711 RepID=A0ABT3L4N7_9CYAN|nr:hypothetical protein [Spirulina subsalsa]MCW6036469.1 hypothetical protein [Spirulina subsalsa FACHB-351]
MSQPWIFSSLKSALTLSLIAALGGLGACEQLPNLVINVSPSSSENEVLPVGEENPNPVPVSAAASPPAPSPSNPTAIKQELQRLKSRRCEEIPERNIGAVLYSLCLDTSVGGRTRILSASSSIPGEQTGAIYWFRDDGEFYAFEQILPEGTTFFVLLDDQETMIQLGPQGQVDSIRDRSEWQDLMEHSREAIALIQQELGMGAVRAAGSPPVGSLLVAGQGGDFNHRTLTLTVPQSDTSRSIRGGAARWYDLHLATMVALTADHYCNHQSTRGVYFNYRADGGDVFMGQVFISCPEARSIMDRFGREEEAWVMLDRPDVDGDSIHYEIPNFTDTKAREFQRTIVRQLIPECIESGGQQFCPGDRY